MTEEELNLFKLSAIGVTQLGTGSAEVVWGDVFQTSSFAAGLDHVPHHILRNAFAPGPSSPGNRSKHLYFLNAGSTGPDVESRLDPVRDRNCSDMSTLPDQVQSPSALAVSGFRPSSDPLAPTYGVHTPTGVPALHSRALHGGSHRKHARELLSSPLRLASFPRGSRAA